MNWPFWWLSSACSSSNSFYSGTETVSWNLLIEDRIPLIPFSFTFYIISSQLTQPVWTKNLIFYLCEGTAVFTGKHSHMFLLTFIKIASIKIEENIGTWLRWIQINSSKSLGMSNRANSMFFTKASYILFSASLQAGPKEAV